MRVNWEIFIGCWRKEMVASTSSFFILFVLIGFGFANYRKNDRYLDKFDFPDNEETSNNVNHLDNNRKTRFFDELG
ncbi:hypothetical protein M0804_013628 [Polistes exclamans]|nr:hypothetical protein M0804_013628 [Polistes exclamans]